MGLISNYVDNRVIKILEQKNLQIDEGTKIQKDEVYSAMQNKAFYQADTAELIKFFKTNRPKNQLISTNSFYRSVTGNLPILHFPLANIITKTMVNLIFSDNPKIEAFSGNKSKDKKLNELIGDIYKENEIGNLLQKAAEYESYSGAVGFKPVLDPDFSEYPILVVYPKEDIEVIKKYDRITEIVFKDYYEKDNGNYILYSICGRGYIDYKLYKDNNNVKNRKEVLLTSLPETESLKRIEFKNKDGSDYKVLMAIYKENKAGSKSDYANLSDDFAALDEIYSNMINFIRKSKIKTYMPESSLKYDTNLNKRIVPSDYDTDTVVLYDSNPQGTEVKINRDIVDINNSIQGYKDAFNSVLLNALSTAGLSPCSVGLDMAGANSSGLALNIRERVSLRTRAEKIKRWEEALQDLTKLIVDLYNINLVNGVGYIDSYNEKVNVVFKEYETPTYSEQVDILSEALHANLIDLESALKLLYPDKTDEEIELMMLSIDGQLPDGDKIVDKELDNPDDEIIDESVEENTTEEEFTEK